MSDDPKHNKIEPVRRMTEELTTLAARWATAQAAAGDNDDKRAIMETAYRLRTDMEADRDIFMHMMGEMSVADIPKTKRSRLFTRLLNYGFRSADWEVNAPTISRWAMALEFCWQATPRPEPAAVLHYIKDSGGDDECAQAAKEAERAAAEGEANTRATPPPIKLSCTVPRKQLFPKGKAISGKLAPGPDGGVIFQPSRKRIEERPAEVLSAELPTDGDGDGVGSA
jgi:hypothetical protein